MEEEGEGVREGEVRVRGGGSGKRETEEMVEEEGEGVREGEVRVRGGGSGKRETEEMVEEECPTRKGTYITNYF